VHRVYRVHGPMSPGFLRLTLHPIEIAYRVAPTVERVQLLGCSHRVRHLMMQFHRVQVFWLYCWRNQPLHPMHPMPGRGQWKKE